MKTHYSREEQLAAFARLLDVQERLRKECPWDRKQTWESMRPHTIEEVYELCDALSKGDLHEVMKEMGDVMEHLMLYAIMGAEDGHFDMAEVCNHQADKLMFRHPFINWREGGQWNVTDPQMMITDEGQVVYRDDASTVCSTADKPQNAEEVLSTWEQVKQRERDGNKSVLSGVPQSLPALIKAYRVQDKARNVGFDWKERSDVWQKVREELHELEEELERQDEEHATDELGDFLFSVINAARLYHLNPDNALERANQKFIRRFNYIEAKAKEQGRTLTSMTLEEMDALWNEAKAQETDTHINSAL